MTLVLFEKVLVLEGSTPKIEDKQVAGTYCFNRTGFRVCFLLVKVFVEVMRLPVESLGNFCWNDRNWPNLFLTNTVRSTWPVVSNSSLFSPRILGEMIQFDYIIFFRLVETTNQFRYVMISFLIEDCEVVDIQTMWRYAISKKKS